MSSRKNSEDIFVYMCATEHTIGKKSIFVCQCGNHKYDAGSSRKTTLEQHDVAPELKQAGFCHVSLSEILKYMKEFDFDSKPKNVDYMQPYIAVSNDFIGEIYGVGDICDSIHIKRKDIIIGMDELTGQLLGYLLGEPK